MVPYGAIDLIYGFSVLESGHGFTNAQAALNIVEATLNVYFLFLRHTSPVTRVGGKKEPYNAHAPLVGFASSLMTLSKTALYFLQGESSFFEGQEKRGDLGKHPRV
jgi:uroporphyrin-III C-methyltransferase